MNSALVYTALAAILCGVFTTGCDGGKDCKTLCAEADACAEFPPDTSCEVRCKNEEELVKVSACEEFKTDFDDCRGRLADICDVPSSCVSEVKAYNDCLGDFCGSSSAAECTAYCSDFPSICDGS
ncbi:MAG: hypothetical protein IPK82_24225 [Polyangiaceae bacterium]|nr:hypothetical protein [Polyangiaceae bacterium]